MNKPLAELIDLTGKTAVVTGGAGGIGLGIVKRLHEAGANVVIADLDEANGQKEAAVHNELRQGSVEYQKVNVANAAEVQKLVSRTIETFGGLDIMVNNAGIFPFATLANLTEEDFNSVIDINLKGVFLGCKYASEAMKEQGGGSIITITSIDALHPSSVGLAAYDASKHGVWGFLKNIALELAEHNIRVNAIAPGGIATPGVANMSQGNSPDDATLETIPMKRLGEPDEIGTVALFLASDLSTYMTGSQVVVDGGKLLH